MSEKCLVYLYNQYIWMVEGKAINALNQSLADLNDNYEYILPPYLSEWDLITDLWWDIFVEVFEYFERI